MKHQPRGFQDGYQRVDLRIHPVKSRNKKDDSPKECSQRECNRTFLSKNQPCQHCCPGNIYHGLVRITPWSISRYIPSKPHARDMVNKNQDNPSRERECRVMQPGTFVEQLQDHHYQQQSTQDEVS